MEFDFNSENMAIVWTKAVSVFCLVLSLLKLSSALLEPNPFPKTLKECYDFRSYNMTPSDEVALMIQNHCFKNYQYKQIADGKVWTAPNITQEGMNYINSLFRKLFGEIVASSKSKHQKRQAAVRFRREVRSPGAFAPFVECIRRLYNTVNTFDTTCSQVCLYKISSYYLHFYSFKIIVSNMLQSYDRDTNRVFNAEQYQHENK